MTQLLTANKKYYCANVVRQQAGLSPNVPPPAQEILLSSSVQGRGTPTIWENQDNQVSYIKCLDRVRFEVSAT